MRIVVVVVVVVGCVCGEYEKRLGEFKLLGCV